MKTVEQIAPGQEELPIPTDEDADEVVEVVDEDVDEPELEGEEKDSEPANP